MLSEGGSAASHAARVAEGDPSSPWSPARVQTLLAQVSVDLVEQRRVRSLSCSKRRNFSSVVASVTDSRERLSANARSLGRIASSSA